MFVSWDLCLQIFSRKFLNRSSPCLQAPSHGFAKWLPEAKPVGWDPVYQLHISGVESSSISILSSTNFPKIETTKTDSNSSHLNVHVKFKVKLTKNWQKCSDQLQHVFPGALALKSTYGRLRLQVEIKMNHGSEPAMVEHHVWVLLINFVVSTTSCVLMRFSSLVSKGQTHRISLRLIWIGVVVVVVGALALVAVTLWCCQSQKKDLYLASNQAACRSLLDLQSKRGFKRYSVWFEESVNAHSFNAMT